MKKLSASPSGVLQEGRTYDLPPGRARALVRARSAVYTEEDPATRTTDTRPAKKAAKKTAAKAQPSTAAAGPEGDGA